MATTRTDTPGPYAPPSRDLSSTAARYGIAAPTVSPSSAFDPSNEATWKVYRGSQDMPRFSDARNTVMSGGMNDTTTSFDAAYADIFNWARQGDPRFDAIVSTMFEANLIPEDWDIKQVQTAWNWAVQNSAVMYGQKTAKMTPEEIIALAARSANSSRGGSRSKGGSGSRGGSGSGPSSRTFTQTSTNVDLSNAETAKAIINKALEDALGRVANDDEIKQFHASLNAKEQANPTKTTSTVTQLASGGGSSSSTTTGGFDGTSKMQYAQDTAKGNSEYAEYQTATTYFDAMMGALASPTGG